MAVNDLKFVDGGAILVQSSGTVPELRFVDGGAYVVHEWVDAPVGGNPWNYYAQQPGGQA